MTRREEVLSALAETIRALGVPFQRGGALPVKIGHAGLVVLRDGAPGQPEVTLSPLTHHYEHRAEVEALVQAARDAPRALDDLIERVGAAIAADRTLGGLCDYVLAEAPEPTELAIEGAPTIRGATIVVQLHYATPDPIA